MKNNSVTGTTQNYYFDFKNSLIVVTAILTFGVCYCITVNAKYNRDTELTYDKFSLKIHSSAPVIPIVPA